MAPSIQLHYFAGSCSLVPQILLEEAQLPYEALAANLKEPAARAEYVKNVNAKGQVPVLVVDGEKITEGPAIQTAISQLAPEKHFFGKTPLDAVRVYEWLNYCSGTVHSASFSHLFRPQAYADSEAGVQFLTTQAKGRLNAALDRFQTATKGKDFIYGDNFTGVDAYIILFHSWAQKFGFDIPKNFPDLQKYVEKLSQRPAVKAVLAKQA